MAGQTAVSYGSEPSLSFSMRSVNNHRFSCSSELLESADGSETFRSGTICKALVAGRGTV